MAKFLKLSAMEVPGGHPIRKAISYLVPVHIKRRGGVGWGSYPAGWYYRGMLLDRSIRKP